MQRTKRGFTLIEMAIVLVIVGLILATTLPLLTERIAKDKLTKGARSVNTLKQEIIGYAMLEGHLPTTDYVASNFSGAEDVWGNDVHYYPADGLSGADGSGNTLSGASSSLTLTRTTSSGSETYTSMAFIIVSEGQNMDVQVDTSGLTADAVGDPLSTAIEYTGDIVFYSRGGYTPTGGKTYDDIVEYVSLPYLQAKVGDSTGSSDTPNNWSGSFDQGIDTMLTSGYQTASSNTQTSGANPVYLDTVHDELSLGTTDGASGCTWYNAVNASLACRELLARNWDTESSGSGIVACYPGSNDSSENWTSLHFVMRFNFLHPDKYTDAAAQRFATSFSFAVISGVDPENIDTYAPCGAGDANGMAYMGYASWNSGTSPVIEDPKFGVEVDAFREDGVNGGTDREDPHPDDSDAQYEQNHIAAVYWEFNQSALTPSSGVRHDNDNLHGFAVSGGFGDASNKNPEYDVSGGAPEAGMLAHVANADNIMWFEDGDDHWLRVELSRTNTSGHDVSGTVTYTTSIFFDDTPNAAFMDMGNRLPQVAGNYDEMTESSVTFDLQGDVWTFSSTDYNINEMMNQFRFGWTTATGDSGARDGQSVNTASIGKFGWGLLPAQTE